jgi:hypothetical protein
VSGALLLLLYACARMGPPAGGPVDQVPPKLLGSVPESLGVYPDWDHDVEFRFDEVVSEGSSPSQGLGTGDLEKLILLSPSRQVPVIHWKRDRITVRPREGWRPNRVYRVELRPGLQDLRRNRTDTAKVLTFSTGGPLPSDTLRGRVIDWVQGRSAVGPLVELVLAPDSLVYRTVGDSSGRFSIGPLPRGRWIVFAAIDQNKNLQRERRENYDSVLVVEGVDLIPALWPIPRDSLGPRIGSFTPNDSVSATIGFSQPLDPLQRIDSAAVRFMLQKDSTPVPFRSLLPKPVDDSLQKIIAARADSLRAAADTTHRDTARGQRPPPVPPVGKLGAAGKAPEVKVDSVLKSRPALYDKLVLRVDSAFAPGTRYLIEISGVRSAAGVASLAKGTLVIPPAKPAAPAGRDTTAIQADSAKVAAPSPSKPR